MNDSYSDNQVKIAELCKAIAHPARVAIVKHLIERDECVCGDLVDELPLSQSTVSQHLKELKKVGLIQGTVSGPSVCYCLNEDVWNQFSNEMGSFFTEILTEKNCC